MPTPTWNGIQTGSQYSSVNWEISSFMLFNWAKSTKSSPDTQRLPYSFKLFEITPQIDKTMDLSIRKSPYHRPYC